MTEGANSPTTDEGFVIVRGDASGFGQEVTAGRNRLTADEPTAMGGTGTGPSPYDLLLAALGA
jgi:putative redox protein